MSNTVTIKHGESVPGAGILAPYELGYVSSEGVLVLGQSGAPVKLNYLEANGTLPTKLYLKNSGTDTGKITFDSSSIGNPKIFLTNENHDNYPDAKISLGMLSSQGICQIIHWGQDAEGAEKYEIFCFPSYESPMAANKTYYVLTSKGGDFAGNFKFTDSIAVDSNSYGTVDPNTAGKTGQVGQLYFVLTE